ncbi:HD domain-containing phosphohydrolase [Deinococcus rufus]|uniref:HD domain-containing phosphohydrolase n=1 Tax=Deinococcus rufus TaxID=2136097 RepID=A0ABV7ZDS9_9DEIO
MSDANLPALLGAFYLNVCIVTTSAVLMGLTYRLHAASVLTAVLRTALYGATSVVLFLHTVPAAPNVFVDLRVVPLALAAYRLGPGWALLAALPLVTYRVWLGGPALPGALTHLALVLCAATLLRRRDARPGHVPMGHLRRGLSLFALPALSIFPTFLLTGRPAVDATVAYLLVVVLGVAALALWLSVVRVMARAFDHASRDTIPAVDVLTGLGTRAAFERDHVAPNGGWSGQYLLTLDLDHFRAVNVQHGRDAGDLALQAVGRLAARHVPPPGRVYRLSGETFAAQYRAPDVQAARQVAEQFRRRVPATIAAALGSPDATFTVSGALVADGPDALDAADQLLSLAKVSGRDRILDAWAPPPPPPTDAPLNGTSPALETVRALLRFIAGNDDHGNTANLQALLDAAITCVPGAQAGSITVRQGSTSVVVVQSGFSDDLIGTRHTVAQMQRWHGDVAAWRAGRARILHGAALRERSRLSHGDDSATQHTLAGPGRQAQLQANLLLPVLVQGEIYAELNLDSLQGEHDFTAESLRVAEEFGLWAAAILSASARIRQAQSAQDAALLTLGVALEARDMETQGHTQRVIDLSAALGAALQLDAAELQLLRQGAALHDLGKLMIPDGILLKAGPLTPEERAAMQTHAAHGAALAAQLPELSPGVLEIIHSHHERWDGRGYPCGLRGEDIPLLARIFSVCDVYDALTSDRPYKRAWSAEDARCEIAAQAGAQFDPAVVAAFLALTPDTTRPALAG